MITYIKGNKRLIIEQEEQPESPRKWSNIGKMICWHKKYVLGDEHPFREPEEFLKYMKEHKVIFLPLRLYDHSGISMSTTKEYPFNCSWDSMQAGYIYVDEEAVKKEYGVKKISSNLKAKVIKILQSEVEIYNQYLTGEVYNFILEKVSHCKTCKKEETEVIESCGGFFGSDFSDSGLYEAADIDNIEEWVECKK